MKNCTNCRLVLVVCLLAFAACKGEQRDGSPPTPAPKPPSAPDASPTVAKPPTKLTLPAHTQLIDPDLLRATCTLPTLMAGLNCFRIEMATGVVRTTERGERFGWVGLRCMIKQPTDLARTVESARSRYDSKMPWLTPSDFCRDVSNVLYTVVIEPVISPGDAWVLAGFRGVDSSLIMSRNLPDRKAVIDSATIKGGAAQTRAMVTGIKFLEKRLGSALELVVLRDSNNSGMTGIDSTWGFDGKVYSDL